MILTIWQVLSITRWRVVPVFTSLTITMKGPSNFGVANDFSFGKEECLNHNLPIFFISLKASSWLGEEELARKIVPNMRHIVFQMCDILFLISATNFLLDVRQY